VEDRAGVRRRLANVSNKVIRLRNIASGSEIFSSHLLTLTLSSTYVEERE
jgi:hypothetical protein